MTVAPNNFVWVLLKSGGYLVFDGKSSDPIFSLKPKGAASPVFFMGKDPDSLGVFGTNEGRIYVVNQKGSVVDKRLIDKELIFREKGAFQLTEGLCGLMSTLGSIYSVTSTGVINPIPWASPSKDYNLTLWQAGNCAVFSNGTVIKFGYDQDDDCKVVCQLLVLPRHRKELLTTLPGMEHNTPFIGRAENGREIAVVSGAKFLCLVNDEGAVVGTTKTIYHPSSCNGSWVKFDSSSFLIDAMDCTTNTFKLLRISTDGTVTILKELTTSSTTPWSTFKDPLTHKNSMVVGFLDGVIRCFDCQSGQLTAQWTDQQTPDSGSGWTFAAPGITKTGLVVQRGDDVVWLDWKKIKE